MKSLDNCLGRARSLALTLSVRRDWGGREGLRRGPDVDEDGTEGPTFRTGVGEERGRDGRIRTGVGDGRGTAMYWRPWDSSCGLRRLWTEVPVSDSPRGRTVGVVVGLQWSRGLRGRTARGHLVCEDLPGPPDTKLFLVPTMSTQTLRDKSPTTSASSECGSPRSDPESPCPTPDTPSAEGRETTETSLSKQVTWVDEVPVETPLQLPLLDHGVLPDTGGQGGRGGYTGITSGPIVS